MLTTLWKVRDIRSGEFTQKTSKSGSGNLPEARPLGWNGLVEGSWGWAGVVKGLVKAVYSTKREKLEKKMA